METLPPEVLVEVFEYLPPTEQLRLERVSRGFQNVSQSFNLAYLKNYIQYLPDELIVEILSYLLLEDAEELLNTSISMRNRLLPLFIEVFVPRLMKRLETKGRVDLARSYFNDEVNSNLHLTHTGFAWQQISNEDDEQKYTKEGKKLRNLVPLVITEVQPNDIYLTGRRNYGYVGLTKDQIRDILIRALYMRYEVLDYDD